MKNENITMKNCKKLYMEFLFVDLDKQWYHTFLQLPILPGKSFPQAERLSKLPSLDTSAKTLVFTIFSILNCSLG